MLLQPPHALRRYIISFLEARVTDSIYAILYNGLILNESAYECLVTTAYQA